VIYQNSKEISAAIRRSPSSGKDVLDSFYERIDQLNPKLNAIVQQFRESAYAQMESLQSADLSTRPLAGVPVTIKESFAYNNSPTTVNFPPLKNHRPRTNSIIADRLEQAGAVILGKTNVPLLLSDSQTFGPIYPTANNPFDLTRTPGGSTGGGAAALAAGFSTIEIGSDIGGSIRNPANFCGLFGLKPTQNGHVHDGHVPPLPNRRSGFTAMNSTGPLARTMSDLRAAYEVCYQPLQNYLQYMDIRTNTPTYGDLSAYRVGWFDEILGKSCSESTRSGLNKVLKTLTESGAQVDKITIDEKLADKIFKTWVQLFGFVVGQDFPWIMRQILKFKFGHDIRKSRISAKQALANGLSMNFSTYSQTLLDQKECIAEFAKYFDEYDFIISPTSVGPAFEHNPKHCDIIYQGKSHNYTDYCFLFVMPYNLMGNPVLTIPSGNDDESNLPIGISIAAQHHSEKQLIHFGELLEEKGFVFKAPLLE
jgi:amidase